VEDRSTRRLQTVTRLDSTGSAVHNAILLSIPDNEYNLLRRHLEHIEFPQHHILQEAGAKIEFAYFLNGGRASLVVLTSDGRSVEVAIVGKDGIVGTPLSVGLQFGPQRAVMQIPGIGLRVKSSVLMDVLNSTPELQVKWNR